MKKIICLVLKVIACGLFGLLKQWKGGEGGGKETSDESKEK